jgi:type IV pilus assembly protein PilB
MLLQNEELITILKQIHLLDDNQVSTAKKYQSDGHVSFADALIELNYISDEQLGILIANHFKLPFINLSKISIQPDVFHVIPEKIARKKQIIAFARDNSGIHLAMANPKDEEVVQMISHKTASPVKVYLATEKNIQNTFYIFKKDLQKSFNALINSSLKADEKHEISIAAIVDLIIETAYYDKASDVHIEPTDDKALVRFRIDGMLHDVLIYPFKFHERIITRIKVESQLRTDEHMSPQDGKMRVEIGDGPLDIRVSIIPIINGEKAVLRLLSTKNKQITLSDLGMSKRDLEKVRKAYDKSYGMILSTGPTGSGKSTSIYAILKILNTRSKNITTIEDPVEYRLEGVNQIQVNKKANLTFASGLRSILRQDPNIILVGEIRDSETAGIAVNAALTGHLVVSTLHTNDSATALPRLIDMKIEPFLVASTVNVIIAQRLVRRICKICKTKKDVSFEDVCRNIPRNLVIKYFGEKPILHIYEGTGCAICHNTKYADRLALFEVLEVSPKIKELILQKADADLIVNQALLEGMTTMFEDGIQKVAKGETTIEEILRVTKVESI